MDFNRVAEISDYLIFFVIVFYVVYILVRYATTGAEKTEREKKQFNRSLIFLLSGGIAGFLISIAALNRFDPDGRISSEKELGIWYLTVLIAACISSLAGFAISGRKK